MNRPKLERLIHASRPVDLLEPSHRLELEREIRRRIRTGKQSSVTPWSIQAYLTGAAAAALMLFAVVQNQPERASLHPVEVLQRPIVASRSVGSSHRKVLLPRIDRLVCAPVDFSLVNRNLPN